MVPVAFFPSPGEMEWWMNLLLLPSHRCSEQLWVERMVSGGHRGLKEEKGRKEEAMLGSELGVREEVADLTVEICMKSAVENRRRKRRDRKELSWKGELNFEIPGGREEETEERRVSFLFFSQAAPCRTCTSSYPSSPQSAPDPTFRTARRKSS